MIRELSVETVSFCNLKCIMCPREGFTKYRSQNIIMEDDIFSKFLILLSEQYKDGLNLRNFRASFG